MMLLTLLLLAAPEETPRLRHGAYVAFLPTAERVGLRLTSIAHGNRADPLTWRYAFGGGGPIGEESWVALGEVVEVGIDPAPPRLGVVCLNAGWSLARAAFDGAVWAIVAAAGRQCTLVDEADFHLFLPAGKTGAVAVGASVTREGCRVRLSAGEEVVADESGDFDQPKVFRLPAGAGDRLIRLEILPPGVSGLNLDDVELTVTEGFAPYLAPSAECAETLGRRWVAWQAQHPSS